MKSTYYKLIVGVLSLRGVKSLLAGSMSLTGVLPSSGAFVAGDRVLIDFGASDKITLVDDSSQHWNNVSDSRLNVAQSGLTVLDAAGNLVTASGADSGVTFSAARAGKVKNVQIGGTAVDFTGSLNANPAGSTYYANAFADSLFVADGTASQEFYQITIGGLDSSLIYDFTFLSAFNGGAGNGNIYAELFTGLTLGRFIVDAGLPDEATNVSSWFQLKGISPIDGEIVINFYSDLGNNGRLNTMEIAAFSPTTYHVATDGLNSNPGTQAAPFRDIDYAASIMTAGDTCLIHAGRYYEQVDQSGLTGTANKPITFKSYGDGPVVIDGTVAVADIQTTGWTHHADGIYKTTLSKDIWQLFDDGEMIMAARWPNAQLDDGSIWDQDGTWAHAADSSTFGTWNVKTSDGRPNLGATGLDFTGAMAILNIGTWQTHSRLVNTHSAGSNTFTYDADNPLISEDKHWTTFKKGQQRAYLEGHLNCLDTAKEWYYNPAKKELYYWAPDGLVPSGDIRGKTIEYGFSIRDSAYVRIQGLEFYGCTFRIRDSIHCTIEDCNLRYFEYTKRMLGVEDPGLHYNSTYSTKVSGSYNTVRNCTFAYCDGGALEVEGSNHLFENIYAHDLDWSGVGYRTFKFSQSEDTIVRRFTVYNAGASECISAGNHCIVELCDMGAGLGVLQRPDGAAIQVRPEQMDGTVVRYNWSHDHIKFGLRFDGDYWDINTGMGVNATFHHNVVWGCEHPITGNALKVKGDYNHIYNNLSYDNRTMDIEIQGKKATENDHSHTYNNAAGQLTGDRTDPNVAVPGTSLSNYVGNIANQVRDFAERDFRPAPGSALIDAGTQIAGITDGYLGAAPDIGPYEYGDDNYWIPGFQIAQASKPIPSDGAIGQTGDRDLIWLGGWEGTSYDIYFGTSSAAVASATRDSSEFQGNQQNNIFKPLAVGNTTCYWRVDTVTPEGTVKGDVWQLSYGTLADLDNDRLFDYWEERFFGSIAASAGGPTDDWDQDGMTDLDELLAGTDPTDPTSLLAISEL